jgi:hypothetical protein
MITSDPVKNSFSQVQYFLNLHFKVGAMKTDIGFRYRNINKTYGNYFVLLFGFFILPKTRIFQMSICAETTNFFFKCQYPQNQRTFC